MRVLFLNPPFHARFSREQRSPAVTKSGTLYYPKWLSHAAGVAIKNGHEVDLVDAPAGGASVQAVIDRISAKNIDAVVCDTSTPSIINDTSVLDALKTARPALHTLMVGRHVSSLPKETLAMCSSLEAVALREYEYTVRDWLAAKDCGASLSEVVDKGRNSIGHWARKGIATRGVLLDLERVAEADGPVWGYHVEDVNLALGNLVADVGDEEAAYLRSH